MNCPNCSTTITLGDRFCEECGTPVFVADQPSCPKCTKGTIDSEGFCESCGFRTGNHARAILTQSPQLGAASDPGLKHFPNEDATAIALGETKSALVVCDGVSSSDRPERASTMAATTTCEALLQGRTMVEAFGEAIAQVQRIPHIPTEEPASTTMVAALVQNNAVTLGWLGDSRAYWVQGGKSQCLTQDHSWANEMVTSGKMTLAAAQQSANAHAITRWIGADNDDTEPSMVTVPLEGAGHLVLCSDGLWNYLDNDDDLSKLIRAAPEPDATGVANHLVEFARSRGGHDNITVAVCIV
jgi:PPM family protein phosphatase